ncbi:MAG: glycosyltransferase [Nitrospinaceae bacterium]|nr:glycosyltransferase family 4 protein [Nitrospinaceae bacterium]NIR53385.1 glycosyltransferase family 4 protein [Nitrospinaceae bacterium]NIS83789.1 glycosyltransferase family 4 protein [Nitrospinaceae bacterium]NIT80588.1 glycosyltransferase family 4 protein [Nitrospinaceae bacterium]NIU42909.1 glycosyltransferase family 4 protein [Nitrospinaceae bacterium]
MKISFLCFDLSDNSLNRAVLLARALAPYYSVELVGPARKGDLWSPMKNLELPVQRFPWKRIPAWFSVVRRLRRAIDGDVLFACKLRPTSFGIGLLEKRRTGKPLIVDIDDWELGFFLRAGFWGRVGRLLNLSNPNGMFYTWLMERRVDRADGILVSNRFLQHRFSGTLVSHCRDTRELDPARFDSREAKRKLGLDGTRVVMFLGTPRAHKGVDDLFAALERLTDPRLRLVIVGADDPSRALPERWSALKSRIVILPPIPAERLPEHLAAADVVAIPQRQTPDTVGQMPAKIFDAMALGKPILSTRVSDIPEVLGDTGYLVEPGNIEEIAETLRHIFDHPEEAQAKGRQARQRCVTLYDTRVMTAALRELVESVVRKHKPV